MKITAPSADHQAMGGVSTSQHHTKYSDANAIAAVVEDAAYGAGWNGDTSHAPSQNALYDKLNALPIPSQADQAAVEGETDEDTYAAPDMIKYSPGVAKGWAEYAADAGLQTPSYNIASVAKESTGLYLVTFDTDFSNNHHSTPVCPTADVIEITRITNAAGSIKFRCKTDGTLTDSGCTFSAFGDQ